MSGTRMDHKIIRPIYLVGMFTLAFVIATVSFIYSIEALEFIVRMIAQLFWALIVLKLLLMALTAWRQHSAGN